MTDRPSARSFFGGAVVVVLSGFAGLLGARLGNDDAEPPERARSEPVRAPSEGALAALDRRIANLENRVDLLEIREPPVVRVEPAAPATAKAAARPSSVEQPPRTPDTAATDLKAPTPEEMSRAAARRMGRVMLATYSTMVSDATAKGAEDRRNQAVLDAAVFQRRFRLTGDDVPEKARRLFEDQWAAQARDIGPIVRNGIENADIATVRERMRQSWEETDRRAKELVGESNWTEYEADMADRRRPITMALDEVEKERLGGK